MQPWYVAENLLSDVKLATTFDVLTHCSVGLCMFLLSHFLHTNIM